MAHEANTLAALPSTRQLAGQPAERQADGIMRAVKARFAHKPAQHLAEILGCDISTAERYFAGARSPSFDNTVTMLRHPVTSVAMLEEATRNLPPDEFQKFWKAMAAAALAAWTRENNEVR